LKSFVVYFDFRHKAGERLNLPLKSEKIPN
jgi:hypothetical protein